VIAITGLELGSVIPGTERAELAAQRFQGPRRAHGVQRKRSVPLKTMRPGSTGLTKKRSSMLFVVAATVLVVAAACSGGGSTKSTPVPTIATDRQTQASPTEGTATATTGNTPAQIDFSSPSGIDGADDEFNYSAMVWQGYWLSRDHFGPLVMGSGMGIPFEPPMEMVTAAMQMVGGNEPGMPFLPENIFPLQAIFRSGDTALVTEPVTRADVHAR